MTDLVIIHPGAVHGIYGDLGHSLIAVEPPLWCRLIAGYIRDYGFSVEIIDQEAEGWTSENVASAVLEKQPKIVCIAVFGHQPSSSTQQMVEAGKVARAIKYLNGMMKIVMVGGHVSALPIRTLQEEYVDYTVEGEGPVTVLGLLNGDDRKEIPGLVWRDEYGLLHKNFPAALLPTKNLHGNAWDLLPMEKYVAHNWQCFGDLGKRQPYASIYTSLGCPYTCSFCCINAPFGTNRYRMRDPVDVGSEIKMLYEHYGVATFKIIDELFILNPRHYIAICDEIIGHDLGDKINIWAYARIDTVKDGYLSRLNAAGIKWLALGIESASAFVRDGSNKAMRFDDIKGVVRAIQAAGINVIGNYIFGLPDDTMQTMRDTLDLAKELNCEFANFYSAMAYPGSKLYREANDKGWKLPATWAGYSQHNKFCRPLDTEHVSAADVLAFRDYAFTSYFTNPDYLEMVIRKFGSLTYEHVKSMTSYNLERWLINPPMEPYPALEKVGGYT
jgi:radical SAM superfamily enzyme YgiQ (UPF0313 family)